MTHYGGVVQRGGTNAHDTLGNASLLATTNDDIGRTLFSPIANSKLKAASSLQATVTVGTIRLSFRPGASNLWVILIYIQNI